MDQRSRSNNEYIDPEEMREIELGKHMVMAYVIQVMLWKSKYIDKFCESGSVLTLNVLSITEHF